MKVEVTTDPETVVAPVVVWAGVVTAVAVLVTAAVVVCVVALETVVVAVSVPLETVDVVVPVTVVGPVVVTVPVTVVTPVLVVAEATVLLETEDEYAVTELVEAALDVVEEVTVVDSVVRVTGCVELDSMDWVEVLEDEWWELTAVGTAR